MAIFKSATSCSAISIVFANNIWCEFSYGLIGMGVDSWGLGFRTARAHPSPTSLRLGLLPSKPSGIWHSK